MAAKKPNTPTVAAGDAEATHLVVKAHRDGFRRAGRAWSVQPAEVAIDEFSAEQIEQLLAEAALTVTPVVKAAAKAAE